MTPKGYFYIAGAILLVGIIARNITLVSVGLLAVLLLGAAWVWQRFCLTGVEYTRRFSEDHVFWGETVTLTVSLMNCKPLPLSWLETDEEFPKQLEFLDYEAEAVGAVGRVGLGHTTALRWFERVTWHYQIRCEHRGLYSFDTVQLRSGDIFGIYTRHETRVLPGHLFVYPRMVPLPTLGFPARYPLGPIRAEHQLLEDPTRTAGVRDYQPGDPFKRIHWPATARRQDLQVRVYEQTTQHVLALFLNIETFLYYWEGIEPERAEWAISVAASLARYADEQRYSFGLFTNAAVSESGEAIRIRPGRNPAQLIHILEALARLTVLPVQGFTELLRAETLHLPWGSTIVVVTPIMTDFLESTLLRLKERGHRVVVCALTPKPPTPLAGILTCHLPLPKPERRAVPAAPLRPPGEDGPASTRPPIPLGAVTER
jgi:uncharacterized protein (DUF58 family)